MTTPETVPPRPFRVGLVAGSPPDGRAYADLARKAESLGFSSLLIPDAPGQTPAAFPMLAWAAAATTTLHVGTYVLSNDLHHPLHVARDAATLAALSGGRFELGLGAGRPGSEADHRAFGLSWDAPAIRFERLRASVGILRDLFAGETVHRDDSFYPMEGASLQIALPEAYRPPILIAAGGDRMLAFAGRVADIVALGMAPTSSLEEVRARSRIVLDAAAGREQPPELNVNLAGAGTTIHPWLQRTLQPRRDELVAAGAPALLLGDTAQMVEQAHRLRDDLVVTYLTAPAELIDDLAPVIRALG
ncbi:MAG: LLM class flavin-dependent oxidoreductase [Thermomicrobiales bacterium]